MPWNFVIAAAQPFAPPPGVAGFDDLTPPVANSLDISPNSVTQRITMLPNGFVERRFELGGAGTFTDSEWNKWFDTAPVGPVAPSDWEVRLAYSSGVDTYDQAGSGGVAINTWIAIDDVSGRRFAWKKDTGIGSDMGVYTLEIRDTATMTLINTINPLNVTMTRDV